MKKDMKEGPDIAIVASLIGDPARANMLTALYTGHALTATELAQEAGVTLQTASSHLSKLESNGLLKMQKQGRHRYFSLADDDVLAAMEALTSVSARVGHLRKRPGPKDPALRKARVCYDHLAGEKGVALLDGLSGKGWLIWHDDHPVVSDAGRKHFHSLGIDTEKRPPKRRPMCRACLDWSVRRYHLAGWLGAALLDHFYDQGWAKREPDSRVVTFTKKGESAFASLIA